MTDLPRIGFAMELSKGFERIAWQGRGPLENYSDRKAAARFGRHECSIDETYVPYIVPQEHGHCTDVSRLLIAPSDRQSPRMEILGQSLFEFNATRHSAEALFRARHAKDLVPAERPLLYIDIAHIGLGTGSCGPDALDRHKLLERRDSLSLEFRFDGFGDVKSDGSIREC